MKNIIDRDFAKEVLKCDIPVFTCFTARWPAHSVPPLMWQQLEELEAQLEEVKRS